jgi:S-methylmethionine-dependent homocysteine/selenocysteine methylase
MGRVMAKYRSKLPQLGGELFLSDGGIETSLIFLDGIELPYFAAFDLLKTKEGRESLRKYYMPYLELAKSRGLGFVLESPTWRASQDWGQKLGYSAEEIAKINRKAIDLMVELRDRYQTTATSPIVISGCIGPRGDGYDPGNIMSPDEAQHYHSLQVKVFRETEADMVSAITMTNVNEAIGLTRAAAAAGMPVSISFTLETDGRLPTGQALKDAVLEVDAATKGAPAYFMINCAHPTHFQNVLNVKEPWIGRIRGLRANASKRSHAELDNSTDLDPGNPAELGAQYGDLRRLLPKLNVFGGCCGTDHRHLTEIAKATAA